MQPFFSRNYISRNWNSIVIHLYLRQSKKCQIPVFTRTVTGQSKHYRPRSNSVNHSVTTYQEYHQELVHRAGLEFNGPVNTTKIMLSWSVYHTSPGQAWSSKHLTSTCAHSFAKNWQVHVLNQLKGENDHRKCFMITLHERKLPDPWTRDLLITSRTCIWTTKTSVFRN